MGSLEPPTRTNRSARCPPPHTAHTQRILSRGPGAGVAEGGLRRFRPRLRTCRSPGDARGGGRTRRVRRHAGFVWGALRACGWGGGVWAASVPSSLGAVRAWIAVVSPGRGHSITALGPPGIDTAGPHGGRVSGHPARRGAHGRAQRPRGHRTNAQACLFLMCVHAGVLGAPWPGTGRIRGAWVGMPTCLPGPQFVRIRATPTSR